MTRFEATNESTEVVAADRGEIWKVLSDPKLLAALTPIVRRIDVDGPQHWCWHLTGTTALGITIVPSFREEMTFTEGERIDFRHDPLPGRPERAGADGVYDLADVDGGTRLHVRITIHADLPLPRSARFAAERVMARSMQLTGDRFGANLYRHLGIT